MAWWTRTPAEPKPDPAWLMELKASLVDRAWEWGETKAARGSVTTMTNAVGVVLSWNDYTGKIYLSGVELDVGQVEDTIKHHLAIKAKMKRQYDFGETAKALAKALLES